MVLLREIIGLFPEVMQPVLEKDVDWSSVQEIRIRVGQPVELVYHQRYEWIERLIPTETEKNHILNQVSQFSLYRLEDELREGFITIEGGHRIGLAGKVNTTNGTVQAIRYIASFNIRVARESRGAARSLMERLIHQGNYCNTLIIGAPQTGKTTLLRDITYHISTGWKGVGAKKVAVIDERSELGASIHGVPQLDLGRRTDIMDACPKSEGMMMMIRSMSPEVLVVDEIGHQRDVDAIQEAINAGVTLYCTVHGNSLDELRKRPSIKQLLDQRVFKRFIILRKEFNRPASKAVILNEIENIMDVTAGGSANEVDRSPVITSRHNMGGI
ncbi:stage III sporulation protein AA [Thalassobacillus cyri]|uniref:Stage III sporulation protein AA n=1 Tax=Thalassobacillus cyri TaxID=571932 RepID=A0A1H4GT58_9BACI|nr:stage III sporulation protein AA [Thalassobacillus cyri]SEB12727.1 stage III sporulation protein AA [Thalassobacillus cyri]